MSSGDQLIELSLPTLVAFVNFRIIAVHVTLAPVSSLLLCSLLLARVHSGRHFWWWRLAPLAITLGSLPTYVTVGGVCIIRSHLAPCTYTTLTLYRYFLGLIDNV